MAKRAATRLRLAVGTLLLTSALAGIINAAGAAAQGDAASNAASAAATSSPPKPSTRPGGRKGFLGINKYQAQPQAYASLIGEPLHSTTGSSVALPDLPQNGGVNVQWEVKLGDKSVLSGSGTVVPLTQMEPGTYTLDVTAANGDTKASGTCLLIVDADSTAPVAITSATPVPAAAAAAAAEPAIAAAGTEEPTAAADAPALDAAATDAANTAAQVAAAAGAEGAEVDAAAATAAAAAAAAAAPVVSGANSAARTAGKPKGDLPYIVISSQHPVLLI